MKNESFVWLFSFFFSQCNEAFVSRLRGRREQEVQISSKWQETKTPPAAADTQTQTLRLLHTLHLYSYLLYSI